MENINIRKYIIDNFKNDNLDKIRDSIETTIKTQDEDALIGLGVLFELLWSKSTEQDKSKYIELIHNTINNQ